MEDIEALPDVLDKQTKRRNIKGKLKRQTDEALLQGGPYGFPDGDPEGMLAHVMPKHHAHTL